MISDHHLSTTAERILRTAQRIGCFIPRTKEDMRIAQYLRGRDLFEQSDNVPGSFELTPKGERILEELAEEAAS